MRATEWAVCDVTKGTDNDNTSSLVSFFRDHLVVCLDFIPFPKESDVHNKP